MTLEISMPFSSSSSRLLGLVLAWAGSCALAQTQPAPGSDGGVRVRGVAAVGALGGGDKLSSVDVRIGRTTFTENVRAGGSFDVRGGVELVFHPQWSMQLTAGYATDGVRADNGKVTFTAWPVEALAHYRFVNAWRVGAGVRVPLRARYEESGDAGDFDVRFKTRAAPVIEVEWLVIPSLGIKLRGMHETYKVDGSSAKVDGNSVGLSVSYYFF